MGFFANFLLGGNADKKVDIPRLIRNRALVVDVRTAAEFSRGCFQGAVNIPYNVITREIGRYEPHKSRTILLYCHSGARAARAKRSLMSVGYTHVVNCGSLRKLRRVASK